jgi:hypothetical protein
MILDSMILDSMIFGEFDLGQFGFLTVWVWTFLFWTFWFSDLAPSRSYKLQNLPNETRVNRSGRNSGHSGVARWFVFKPKIPILVKMWRALEYKMLLFFMTFWNILRPVGIIYIQQFGIACGRLVYFFRFGMFGPRKIWQPWSLDRPRRLATINRKIRFDLGLHWTATFLPHGRGPILFLKYFRQKICEKIGVFDSKQS